MTQTIDQSDSQLAGPGQGAVERVQAQRPAIVRASAVLAPRLPSAAHRLSKAVLDTLPSFLPIIPQNVDPFQFQHALIIAANELNPEKIGDPESVIMAAYACCVTGLSPGKTLGLAYFVPFKGVVQFIPGYKGFVQLAHYTGFVSSIHTDVVYEGEEFDYWTDENGPRLMHRPALKADRLKGNPIAAYCISGLCGGGRQIRVLTLDELKRAEKDTDVWKSYRHEMWMKTAIRRASKLWKMTKELGAAVRLDEQAEAEEAQHAEGWKGAPSPKPSADPSAPVTPTREDRQAGATASHESTSAIPKPSKPVQVTAVEVTELTVAWWKKFHAGTPKPVTEDDKASVRAAWIAWVDKTLGPESANRACGGWAQASAWTPGERQRCMEALK